MWARTDYFPVAGIAPSLLFTLNLQSQYPAGATNGVNNMLSQTIMMGTISDPLRGGPACRITDITDGTSNTLIVAECSGRPGGFNVQHTTYNSEVDGLPVDGVIEPVSAGGGCWADYDTYSGLAGGRCDDSGLRLGPCMINATSNRRRDRARLGRPAVEGGLTVTEVFIAPSGDSFSLVGVSIRPFANLQFSDL